MKKLRWTTDGEGGGWELDMSTPVTLEGEARPVPGDPLPLGLSRGTRLSRPKQADFFQRFMAAPFLPCSSPSSHGFSLLRLLSFPFTPPCWFATFLGRFNLQKFISDISKDNKGNQPPHESSHLQRIRRHLRDQSLYALGFSSELSLTPYDTLVFAYDGYGDTSKLPRKKAVLRHEFPHHDLTMEAASPALFVDKSGNYWDVPLSMAIDLASVDSDSGSSYRFCMQHNMGNPKQFGDGQALEVPAALLPGTSLKSAFSFKKSIDMWKSQAYKLKLAQPYDLFISNPHISASGIIGGAVTACLGDNSVRSQSVDVGHRFPGFFIQAPAVKSVLLADLFSTVSLTAQHGNFQRMFLDLTRLSVRMDFPSGAKLISGVTQLTQDFLNSRRPTVAGLQAVCPDITLSLQQQIAGPFSFRVDSAVAIDLKAGDLKAHLHDPVFAVEYALQVLGSAKAVAWYSPKQKEFMGVEVIGTLRAEETEIVDSVSRVIQDVP